MKKLIMLNVISIAISFLLFLNLDNLLKLSWNWGLILMFLPITTGALTALIQDEDRSYKYLPKIILGSLIFSFLLIFSIKFYVYIAENLDTPLLSFFNPFKDKDEILGHLGLSAIYIFGGLVGIVIRGINILLKNKTSRVI